jgi:cobalt-precorrin 5A hydrolase
MTSTTAVIAISRHGSDLARRLSGSLGDDSTLFLDHRFVGTGDDAVAFDLPVRPVVEKVFDEYRRLVLFMPVGAAVRLLASRLSHKHSDPAVVCVDDAGRFAVSLLSGHSGGADQLAREVASILGSTAVITSASHVIGTLAVDLLGKEFGWRLAASPTVVTRVSAAVINGEPTGIFQSAGETTWWPHGQPLPQNIQAFQSLEALASSSSAAALLITDETIPDSIAALETGGKKVVVYRPRSLVVGMGCRKGVPAEELEQLLVSTFQRHGLALESIGCIATAEIKQHEPGILELADKYVVALRCFGVDELNGMFQGEEGNPPNPPLRKGGEDAVRLVPDPSSAPYRLLGVWGVSEPAALLASGATELLVAKERSARATVAVARMVFG